MPTMQKNTPTITPAPELVATNTQLLKKHYLSLIYLLVLPSLLYLLGNILLGNFGSTVPERLNSEQILGLAVMLIGFVWLIVNLGPTTYFMIRAAKGKNDDLRVYYKKGLKFTWRLMIYYILYVAAIIIGLLLFIVPGVIIFQRYFLGFYYLVDQDLTVRQAFRAARKDAKQYKRAIWGIIGVEALFFLAAGFMGIVPVIGVILGQLLTYGCVFLPVLRYNELTRSNKHKLPPA